MFKLLAQRIRTWWDRRQHRRQWQALSPEQQLTVWIQALHTSPELREALRIALRVRSHEDITRPMKGFRPEKARR